ncbi:MAG: aminopeptidase [Chloroflexi bacterium]|nr:aminopeptidase [Chloroflexota bacterium]
MSDPRIDKLADVLVNYSIEVQAGDWVLISGHYLAVPLLNAVIAHVLKAGGHPTALLDAVEFQETILREASDTQLEWISPLETTAYEQVDATIGVSATQNTRALTNVDPERQRIRQNARRELMKTFMRRSAEGSLRWVGTLYPCPAYAQEADMSLNEYEDFVYKATFADQPDPVKHWTAIHDEQARLIEWLKGKEEVVVRGPDIDLTLSIAGRTWINSDGKKNMPSGEIFTGPVEQSVTGWVRFTYPAIRSGREVEGVELTFEDGRVVTAKASKNEGFLLSQLDSDPGARYLGEFAIGTNYGITQFTKNILYDEKIGGTIHMAVGAGYPETGSQNESTIHWDLICDMRNDSEIVVDGELFYKNGKFQV